MRIKLITLPYSTELGAFDDAGLVDFVEDKQVLAFREHFFTVHDIPSLVCVVV